MPTHKKTTKKSHTTTSSHWFRPLRGSYLPISWQGWLTYIPYVLYLYLSYILLVSDRPVLDTIVFLIPYWLAGVIVMHWIAKRKS